MKNYFYLRSQKAIIIGIFAVLFLGYLLGIRFENVYINKIAGLLLYFSPICIFILILKEEFKSKSLKVTLSIVAGLLAFASLVPIFFNAFDLYAISQDGGIDPAFEKTKTLNLESSRVAVYRTNGGATTDFGLIVRSEKALLPGIYIKHDLINLYHVDDINLSVAMPNSVKIDSINFTDPQYRTEYMSENPDVTEGQIIKI